MNGDDDKRSQDSDYEPPIKIVPYKNVYLQILKTIVIIF